MLRAAGAVTITAAYDDDGRLTSRTDPAGLTWTRTYETQTGRNDRRRSGGHDDLRTRGGRLTKAARSANGSDVVYEVDVLDRTISREVGTTTTVHMLRPSL
jgi:YD repeat-containing protein